MADATSSIESRRGEAERHLALLAGAAPSGAFFDVRWRRRRAARMAQDFRQVAAPGTAELLVRLAAHSDVYIGVAARTRRAGGREALAPCAFLWADSDTAAAVAALRRVPQPTMLVASSEARRHAYWLLHASLSPERIAAGNRRLAAALGADAGAVTSPATILRPPGTFNHKHTPPAPVRLIELHETLVYRVEELLDDLPPLPESVAPPARRGPRAPRSDPLLQISPREYVRLLTGERVSPAGTIHCPLHEDQDPSLHAWADPARGWFCFGCNRGGTIYDLAAAMWLSGQAGDAPLRGREFVELRRRLLELCAVSEET